MKLVKTAEGHVVDVDLTNGFCPYTNRPLTKEALETVGPENREHFAALMESDKLLTERKLKKRK